MVCVARQSPAVALGETLAGGALAAARPRAKSRRREFRSALGCWCVLAFALAANLMFVASPAWAAFPGANGKIAFVRGESIWIAHSDGSHQRRIAAGVEPAWSADGARIAFERDGNVWVMKANGKRQRQLTALGGSHPRWAPDGARIVFRTARDTAGGNGQIYVMNADGTDQHAITSIKEGLSYVADPDWSADGRKIAVPFGFSFMIFMGWIAPDGTGGAQLEFALWDQSYDPDWSPDSEALAYAARTGVRSERPVVAIWVDDSLLVQGETDAVGSWVDLGAPAWSPDATKILFERASSLEPASAVWIMNPDGSGQARLIPDATAPDWQPKADRGRRGERRRWAGRRDASSRWARLRDG